MTEQIRGKWPGGPSGRADAVPPARPPRTRSVGELEDRIAGHRERRSRGARTRRIAIGFIVSSALAGGIGWYIGERSHVTPEEINREREAAAAPRVDLSTELNRAMLELWRMEDVEYMRNRPRP